jgi:hypothetical protein
MFRFIIVIALIVGAFRVVSRGSRLNPTDSLRHYSEVNLMNQVRAQFKDPNSAEFAETRMYLQGEPSWGSFNLCGAVNAKNGFGGYVGFTRFVAFRMPDPKEHKMIEAVVFDGEGKHDVYQMAYNDSCHNEAVPQ